MTVTVISSLHNPRIKAIRALKARKERERTGLLFVEGIRIVLEAIALGATVETLVVAPDLLISHRARESVDAQRRLGLPCLEVSADVFASISRSISHKYGPWGFGAVVRQRWEPLASVRPQRGQCWVALDEVADPGNLGTILRTNDAVGGCGVILIGHGTDPYDPASVRASMGSIFAQRLVRATLDEFAAWRRAHRCTVIGTACEGAVDYRAVDYPDAVVLLMGSERHGLPPEQRALCDRLVTIPMSGHADSLNLGVATGIMLYEMLRQRHASGSTTGTGAGRGQRSATAGG